VPPSANADVLVDIRDVGFAYSGAWAVDSCSFDIKRGHVTGLIGPNGAGKSTLLELLSGALAPQRGTIVYRGEDISGCGPSSAGRKGIVRTFQTARLLARLPVIENVLIAAPNQVGENPMRAVINRRSWRAQEASLREEAHGLLTWLGIHTHAEAQAGTLSGGQRKLLEIARAMMAHPTLLLLDEPTAGVFPETSRLIAARVRDIADQGVTILVVAHNMGFLADVSNDVVVMAEGKVLTRGTLDSVRQHSEVIAAYLGATSVASLATQPEHLKGA
jgi:ABC-type branched-subunit amino acid transport system ATPase component